MQIDVRIAIDEDPVAELFSAMVADLVRFGGEPIADEATRVEFFRAQLRESATDGSARCVVACDSQRSSVVVGAARARIVERPAVFLPERLLHISEVYVIDTYRAGGIGTKLLDALFDWGRERGCQTVDINVLPRNPAAQWYERLGFRETKRRMQRPLT